ncbi:unnamed protein product [Pleuronectes platessa]|uniref:Uncharacterized protein n=1 Tax=Pleuronectes platessa TaxID=8262 RepID=A0A9N7YTR7_PLEPL|nr:unnamed protein product [Pleuronectes platessa]
MQNPAGGPLNRRVHSSVNISLSVQMMEGSSVHEAGQNKRPPPEASPETSHLETPSTQGRSSSSHLKDTVSSHYSSGSGGERGKRSQPAVRSYHRARVCRQTGQLGLHLLRYTGARWQQAISRWRLAKGQRLERGQAAAAVSIDLSGSTGADPNTQSRKDKKLKLCLLLGLTLLKHLVSSLDHTSREPNRGGLVDPRGLKSQSLLTSHLPPPPLAVSHTIHPAQAKCCGHVYTGL